jgi:TRAP-type C4-dicarboxylate transport system permease small subunit
VLTERDHVTFDLLYLIVNRRMQRVFALVSAAAIVAGFLAALPATFDYITFYKIKKSATLHIRLDIVFSVYGMFAVATIVRYAWHIWRLLRGDRPEPHDEATPV